MQGNRIPGVRLDYRRQCCLYRDQGSGRLRLICFQAGCGRLLSVWCIIVVPNVDIANPTFGEGSTGRIGVKEQPNTRRGNGRDGGVGRTIVPVGFYDDGTVMGDWLEL